MYANLKKKLKTKLKRIYINQNNKVFLLNNTQSEKLNETLSNGKHTRIKINNTQNILTKDKELLQHRDKVKLGRPLNN